MQSTTTTQFDQIAMELLETERCYVNDLSDVIQVKAVFRVAALIVSRKERFFCCSSWYFLKLEFYAVYVLSNMKLVDFVGG